MIGRRGSADLPARHVIARMTLGTWVILLFLLALTLVILRMSGELALEHTIANGFRHWLF